MIFPRGLQQSHKTVISKSARHVQYSTNKQPIPPPFIRSAFTPYPPHPAWIILNQWTVMHPQCFCQTRLPPTKGTVEAD